MNWDKAQPPKLNLNPLKALMNGLDGWKTHLTSAAVMVFGLAVWWCHNNAPEWESTFIYITNFVLVPLLASFLRMGSQKAEDEAKKSTDVTEKTAQEVKEAVTQAKEETIDAAAAAIDETAIKVKETVQQEKNDGPVL